MYSPLPPAFAPEIGDVEIAMIDSSRKELGPLDCQLICVIGDDVNKV
jgi:hypothetical protein